MSAIYINLCIQYARSVIIPIDKTQPPMAAALLTFQSGHMIVENRWLVRVNKGPRGSLCLRPSCFVGVCRPGLVGESQATERSVRLMGVSTRPQF